MAEAEADAAAAAEAEPDEPAAAEAAPTSTGDIEEIEGIGPAYAEKLRAAGVPSVEVLLEKGATPEGRGASARRRVSTPSAFSGGSIMRI